MGISERLYNHPGCDNYANLYSQISKYSHA